MATLKNGNVQLKDTWAFPEMNFSRNPTEPCEAFKRSKPPTDEKGNVTGKGFIDAGLGTLVSAFVKEGGFSPAKGTGFVLVKLTKQQKATARRQIERMVGYLTKAEFLRKDDLTVTLPGASEEGEAANRKLKIPTASAVEAFKAIWMPKGKAVTPTYGVQSGNRRSFAMPYINAALVLEGHKAITSYPAEVRSYKDRATLILDNCKLNEDHKDGMRELSHENRIYVAAQLYAEGCAQALFRRTWPVGTAQFLWEVVVIDSRYPSVNLVDRIIKGEVKVTSGDKENLRKVRQLAEVDANGLDIKKSPKRIATRAKDAEVLSKATAMLDSIFTGQAEKRQKGASKTDMETLAGRHKVEIVKTVLSACGANNLGSLASLNEHAEMINACVKAILDGKIVFPLYIGGKGDPVTQETLDALVKNQKSNGGRRRARA